MGRRKDFQPAKSAAFGGGRTGGAGSGGGGGLLHFDPLETSADPLAAQIAATLKRLSKRDATTKLKALKELQAMVDAHSDEAAVTRLIIALPQWCYCYQKLAFDNTVQVCQLAHQLMGSVADLVKQEIEPHVTSVIGRWWMAQFDPRVDAGGAAAACLQATFPGRRINRVLRMCQQPVLGEIEEALHGSPKSVMNSQMVDELEIAKDMYERQVYCAMLALKSLIKQLVEVDKFEDSIKAAVSKILDASFWKLAGSKYERVRSGFYILLPALCDHLRPVISENLDRLAPAILGGMSESSSYVHAALWPAMIHFSKTVPESWSRVGSKDAVLKKMWACLESGANGGLSMYPSLLLWLSVVPDHFLSTAFVKNFMGSLWRGAASGSAGVDLALLARTWAECSVYCLREIPTRMRLMQERAASGTTAITSHDLAGWGDLPNPPKPQGKPTAEQVIELKHAKQLRAQFLASLASRLEGEWTPKKVETELAKRATSHDDPTGQPAAEAESASPGISLEDLDTNLLQACLVDPLKATIVSPLAFSSNSTPMVVALAAQMKSRPRLEESVVATVWSSVVLMLDDCEQRHECGDRLCAMLSSFQHECNTLGVETDVAKLAVRSMLSLIGITESIALPSTSQLQTFASLVGVFGHATLLDDATAFMHDQLVNWLVATPDRSTRKDLLRILSSYLLQVGETVQSQEWNYFLEAIFDLPGYMEILLDLFAIDDTLQVPNLEKLNSIATTDLLNHAIDAEESVAADLLCQCIQGRKDRSFLTAESQLHIAQWLQRELTAAAVQAADSFKFRRFQMIAEAVLACPSSSNALAHAHESLLLQLFKYRVPWTYSSGDQVTFVSDECASCCSSLWQMHRDILLETDHWSATATTLMAQSIKVLLLPDLRSSNKQDDAARLCVLQVLELLAMTKVVSAEGMHARFRTLLEAVVPALSGTSTTVAVATCPWPRLLSFSLGLIGSLELSEVFLCASGDNADVELRAHLFVQILSYADGESFDVAVELQHKSNRPIKENLQSIATELHLFWGICCQGQLFLDPDLDPEDSCLDEQPTEIDRFVLAVVHAALELSSTGDEKFASCMDTLFVITNDDTYREAAAAGRENLMFSERTVDILHSDIVGDVLDRVLDASGSLPESEMMASVNFIRQMLAHIQSSHRWAIVLRCEAIASKNMASSAPALALLGEGILHELLDSKLRTTASVPRRPRETTSELLVRSLNRVREGLGSQDAAGAAISADQQLVSRGLLSLLRCTLVAPETWLISQSEWEFHVSFAIRCATEAQEIGLANTPLHCDALCVIEQTLAELQDSKFGDVVSPASQAEYEDRLTGAAYTQLVDTEALWRPSVWQALARILPNWAAPERTLMIEYADELVLRLTHPLVSVRVAVYHLLLRIIGTSLAALGTASDDDEEDAGEDELSGWNDQSELARPSLLPDALWDIIEGRVPKKSDLRSIPGYFFAWGIVLQTVAHAPLVTKAIFTDYIRASGVTNSLLNTLAALIPMTPKKTNSAVSQVTVQQLDSLSVLRTGGTVRECAVALYGRTLAHLPAVSRGWFNTLARAEHLQIERYTGSCVTPSLVRNDLGAVNEAAKEVDGLEVTTSVTAREVTATYLHEDCNMSITIALSDSHPLKIVEVSVTHQTGLNEARSRRTLLSITKLLSHKDGTIRDAVMLWKSNLDRQFAGAEPCIICYSVIHASSAALPRLKCKTCEQKFHSACLYKWFQQSQKSNCPHCQSAWF